MPLGAVRWKYNHLSDVPAAIAAGARQGMANLLDQGVAVARELAPYETGTLYRSIGSSVTSSGLERVIGNFFCTVDYAMIQEFGNSRIRARLFMTGAVEKMKDQYEAFIGQQINLALQHLGRAG